MLDIHSLPVELQAGKGGFPLGMGVFLQLLSPLQITQVLSLLLSHIPFTG